MHIPPTRKGNYSLITFKKSANTLLAPGASKFDCLTRAGHLTWDAAAKVVSKRGGSLFAVDHYSPANQFSDELIQTLTAPPSEQTATVDVAVTALHTVH